MEVREIDIELLIPDPDNERLHDKKNLAAIRGSIKQFGIVEPLVVREQNNIVLGGNGRLQVLKEMGFKTVPIHYVNLDDHKAAALRAALNRTSELASWDTDKLSQTLKDLVEVNFDIADIGFGDEFLKEEPVAGLTDPDSVPENVETRCKPGDLWILGNHRLLCGDSTNVQHVERLMGGQKAELCFTSPPYADQREYNGGKELSTEYLATFIRAAASSCDIFAVNLGISRKDNEVNTYWDDYIKEARDCGLKFLSWNVWNKQGFGMHVGNATAMFGIEHEWILVFGEFKRLRKTVENKHKTGSKTTTIRMPDGSTKHDANPGASHRQLGTIWSGDVYRGQDGFPHPAMFPVALPEAYIEACTSSNENVYEPFTGSGSTLIACEKTNRKCYGMEIDPKYCDVIIERWEKFTGQKAVLYG